ncbi:MAG: TetR family transcriptional regulator [Desulfobacterales bacterium]|nr:TetR family transcriptional regulator [Desulfobacterales bacterium]
MASRDELKEQKEKTSKILIQAALELISADGYASLTLRSVARKAGIAPTSFYRHFRDIDELGLSIAEQAKMFLIECMEQIQKKMKSPVINKNDSVSQKMKSIEQLARPFVEIFLDFFETHSHLFRLFFQEQSGSSSILQTAISKELKNLTNSLAEDIGKIARKANINLSEPQMIAEVMMTMVSVNGMKMLINPELKQTEIAEQLIRTIQIFVLGCLTTD